MIFAADFQLVKTRLTCNFYLILVLDLFHAIAIRFKNATPPWPTALHLTSCKLDSGLSRGFNFGEKPAFFGPTLASRPSSLKNSRL
jgi:hypothetical protein